MKRKNSYSIIMTFLIIAAIFIADKTLNIGISAKIFSFLKPIGIVFEQTGKAVAGGFQGITNIGKLQKENKELTNKLNKAIQELALLNEAQKENAGLKRDLEFKENNNFELIPANVISFDPSNVRETITINIGAKNGIKNGNIVVSEGFLIGKVIDASSVTAKIKLISDPQSAIPANIMTSSVSGIVKGTIGNGLNLEQVPQSEKINSGDIIVTSGLGGDFPKGLVIGKVEEIQKISGSIFQLITVRPMVDLNRLEKVMVIKE